ncbi:MAG: sulfatase [Elusimicrobia bacterium]|nr:sulfatase [Elusimicrobiota bacterium]
MIKKAHIYIVVGLLAAAYFTSNTVIRRSRPKNIIIFLADALRYDHVGCYGYDKKTTPFIDQKAAEGVLYENAFTTGQWTITAVASLFTGLYPFQHRTTDLYEDGTADALPSGITTLAELLAGGGYKTYGFYGMTAISHRLGFARGFDLYAGNDNYSINDYSRLAEFKRLFLEYKDEKKFFYLHFQSPHEPYGDIDEAVKEKFRNENGERVNSYPYGEDLPAKFSTNPVFARYNNIGECMLGYDEEIYLIDTFFREMWEFLERMNALEDTLLIFCADHGEHFGEYGIMGHGYIKYEETTHIPLIIWDFKSGIRGRVKEAVSLIDIMPTICSRIGIEPEKGGHNYGINILKRSGLPSKRGIIAEQRIPGATDGLGIVMYRTADKKLFLNEKDNLEYMKIVNGRQEPMNDPSDFVPEQKVFTELLDYMRGVYYKARAGDIRKLDKDELKNLKELGYLQ